MNQEFTISKTDVYNEVRKTTEYTGRKMEGDESAFERIGTTDDDVQVMDRFFSEAIAEVGKKTRGLLFGITNADGNYNVTLDLSVAFDTSLLPAMQSNLFSFFVQRITALWFVFTNKKEAGEYADHATSLLEEFRCMAYSKKMPTRPTYN